MKTEHEKKFISKILDELAKAIGMKSRNTILNWAKKTKAGEMDMPMLSARTKRALVFIPVRAFLDWYCYEGQN